MGEARRRGVFENRRAEAIKRNKAEFVNSLGVRDPQTDQYLRAGMGRVRSMTIEAAAIR